MPYSIVEFPDGFRVMTDDTGMFHSKDALPLERAKKQLTALNIALAKERGGSKTYRQRFLDAYSVPDRSYSLAELSKISNVPMDILQEVYNRGIGAYKGNPQSVRLKTSFVKNVDAPLSAKLSKEQWAIARVYSFLMGNPKHDNDLRANKGSGKCGLPMDECKCDDPFMKQLKDIGYAPSHYLAQVKTIAQQRGYDPNAITFTCDGKKKLQITTPDGKVRRFGAVGYGDFLIWSYLEQHGKVDKGTAKEKRDRFQVSHRAIKGNWKDDKYSPNMLALKILW